MRLWIKRGGLPLSVGLLVALAGCGSGGGEPSSVSGTPTAAAPAGSTATASAPAPTTATPTATPTASTPATSVPASATPTASTPATSVPTTNSAGTVPNANLVFADGFALKSASCANPVTISTNGRLANAMWVGCATAGNAVSVIVDVIQNKIKVRYGDSLVGQHEFESALGVTLAPITAASNRIVFNNVVLTRMDTNAFAGLGGALPIAPTTITVTGDLAL